MSWSSRENGLRKNTSTPTPKPIEQKEKINTTATVPVNLNTPEGSNTLDERSLKNILTLHKKVQSIFTNWINECKILAKAYGYEYKAISGNRSWDEQAKLYAQGRTSPGKIITNAKPGYSNHNFGIAVDMGVFKNGKYLDENNPDEAESFHRIAAKTAEKYNIEWGGNWKTFKDYPHFEYKTGKTLSQLRQLIAEGKDIFA